MTITFLVWFLYQKLTLDPVPPVFYLWNIWNKDALNYPWAYFISAAGKGKCGNFDISEKSTFLLSRNFAHDLLAKLCIPLRSQTCSLVEGSPKNGTHISIPRRVQKLGCMTPLCTERFPDAAKIITKYKKVSKVSLRWHFALLCSLENDSQKEKRWSVPFFSPLAFSLRKRGIKICSGYRVILVANYELLMACCRWTVFPPCCAVTGERSLITSWQ